MEEVFTLNSAHNFGIYTKSGKRTIFQIDFSCKRISLIERGKISKSFEFSHLDQYDSEENLHIVIRFRNNKVLEFDADTAEEKYTICRLLGIALNPQPLETNGIETRENGVKNLSTKKQILKEGILDKKGNTKIPTWSRRRLQVCPGEFSYYKPGDEVALNLVQLWENATSVNTNGQSGFIVAVRDRSYYFRLPNEKGVNTEQERDKWVQAFKQASQRKRATFLLLEMSKNTEYINTRQNVPLPSIPADDEEEVGYYNQNTSRSTMSSSDSNSSREILEGLEETSKMNGGRSFYRKFLVPLMTGNTMYALLGINWGGKKEAEDKNEKRTVIDMRQEVLNKADFLYSENKAEELYNFLKMHQHSDDDEILWRLARAAVDKGKLSEDKETKKELYYEAFEYIKKALEINTNNFAVHKWYAILLDYTGELEGNKQRLINAVQVKEHFQKAIELNPKDATSIHSLGQWCFTFAAMPWYQRNIAAMIYATPPTSTFEEALKYFLQAEETEPNFYSMNLLMLGKTYMRLRDAEMAVTYLNRCVKHPVKTPDDKKANDEAGQLLNVLTQKKPSSTN